jgi:hypothetical protein
MFVKHSVPAIDLSQQIGIRINLIAPNKCVSILIFQELLSQEVNVH